MPFPPAPADKSKPSAPPDAKAPPAKEKSPVDKAVGIASKMGNLKPVEDFLKNEGLNYTIEEFMKAAAEHPETKGKSPDELVSILMDEPGVLDDILNTIDAQKGNPEEKEEVMGMHEAMDKKMQSAYDAENGMGM